MRNLDAQGRGWRAFLFLALILFILQVSVLLAVPSRSTASLLSNSLQAACAFFAGLSALDASRRMAHFARHFWLLVASGFFIWTAAQIVATYYDSILRYPLQQPWPSDVIFFVSMAPAFMTLFIDVERGVELKDSPRLLDLAQVAILTIAAYLFTFHPAAHWRMDGGLLARYAWLPDCSRDAFLALAFSLRAILSRGKLERALFGRLAIFFVLYLSGELPYLYLQSTRSLPSGTPMDLVWSVPFLVIAVLAANAPAELPGPGAETQSKARAQRRNWGLIHVVPLVFPLLVLWMAAGAESGQLTIAVVMVLASFVCSSTRILITEKQKRAADMALEEKNALLKSIFEGSDDAIYIKDVHGRYVIVNPAFKKHVEGGRDQIIGRTAEDLFGLSGANEVSSADQDVIRSGQPKTTEYELPLRSGTRTFLTTRSPYRDGEGKIIGVIAIARDITERRTMEERLRQSQKMEAIGTLAGGVAHDFNNLLMVIGGYGSVLHEALEGKAKLQGHVEQIQKASDRAASLTRQLLAFSRKQTIQPIPLNLNNSVSGMEKLLRRLIGENIAICTKLAPDLGATKADPGQIEQVLLNLAVNARDAMPSGGKLVFETKNVPAGTADEDAPVAVQTGSFVELLVQDTGIGMDEEVQAHVFEPYFTTKPAGKGTGLGLSTVYGIVQQAGGFVTFSSKPGEGTAFRVFLPRMDSAQAPLAAADSSKPAYAGEETVLLAEDEPAVCDLVRAVLTSRGYNVLSARLPKEAEMLSEQHRGKIDLLLTDVIMPGMGGAELSRRVAARNPGIKVLFMSGYIDDSVMRHGIEESEAAFLQKPFTPLGLAKKVREVLDGTPMS